MKKFLAIFLSVICALSMVACNVHEDDGKACTGEHSFTNYVYDDNATCDADGTETARCDNIYCGAKDTRKKSGTRLSHECVFVATTSSTCITHGVKEHYECIHCNRYYKDANAQTQIQKDTLYLPLIDCNVQIVLELDATCYKEGRIRHYKCSICNACFSDSEGLNEISPESVIVEKCEHEYEEGFTKDSVVGDKVIRSRHCVNFEHCGAFTDQEEINKEDDDDWSPNV